MNKRFILKKILHILLIVGIGAHILASCSSDSSEPAPDTDGAITSSSSLGSSSSGGSAVSSSSVVATSGTFEDSRDSKTYGWVKIGSQTWMAENLNYNASGSKCYGEDGLAWDDDEGGGIELSSSEIQANCAKYGRLYNWATAMNFDSACNTNAVGSASCNETISAKHRGICPEGWHVPTNEEWDALYRYADGTTGTNSPHDSPEAGKHLKAQSGWINCGPSGSGSSYLCEDTHGFAAPPGGYGRSDGYFFNAGYYGYWWSASEYNAYSAYHRSIYHYTQYAYWNNNDKFNLFSLRCVKD